MSEALVRDIMRSDPRVVSPDDSVGVVAGTIVDSGVPGVPVVEHGKIVGIITEGDLVTRQARLDLPARIPLLDAVFVFDAGRPYGEEVRRVMATSARDLMTHPVYNILETATVSDLATLMLEENVNPVPVVNAAHELVGIVSRGDLVRMIARLESAPSDTADETS